MDIRTNAGYIITDCVHIGEAEFVLGVHSKHPDMFVTWEYNKENDSYFWGHYHTDLLAAQKDLNKRCQDEIKQYECLYGRDKNKERDIER